MGIVAEPFWINRASGVAARNGTSSVTISFGFTSTAGNRLVLIVGGPITHTNGGWTKYLGTVFSGELAMFSKISTGDSSFTDTLNAADYPVVWCVYEIPPGSVFYTGIGGDNSSNYTFPTVALPGSEQVVFAVRGQVLTAGSTASTTWSSPYLEDAAVVEPHNGTTAGYYISVGHSSNVTGATETPSAATTCDTAVTDVQHLVFSFTIAGSSSFVAASTPAAAGTTNTASTVSITPTLPTGTASGDRVYVVQAGNNTSGTTPTSWTAAAKDTQVGPTGTAPGAGTGRRYLSIYYRDYDGVWTMPAFTLTSAAQNTQALSAITLRKGATDSWDTPVVTTAGNTASASTAYSVTTGSVTLLTGMAIVGTATNDNVTASGETLAAATGTVTFSGLTEQSDTGSATGNDVSIKAYTAVVASGGVGTITHAATLSGASEGGSVVVAQPATLAVRPLPSVFVRNQAAVVVASSW